METSRYQTTIAPAPEDLVRDYISKQRVSAKGQDAKRVSAIGQDAISQGTCKDEICDCLGISSCIACNILCCWLELKAYGV